MTDATALAHAALEHLLAAGVTDVVVAPGSRNAPLSFAVWAAAEAGAVRLHTRIDERSAGFLALGLTKVGARAAVACTSGTAAANLHPAALEAAHSGLPLVVVTADRPARLRATGANQTTDQREVFGPLVTSCDVAAAADLPDLPPDAPVHLNVQFDEPLVPDPPNRQLWRTESAVVASPAHHNSRLGAPQLPIRRGPRTVVVAGDDAGPPARTLAEHANWPLLAEPSSGSRTGDNAIRTYRLLLAGDLGRAIERVVVVGRPTLSRPVSRLLARDDVEVLVVPGRGAWPVRPPGSTTLEVVPTAEPDDGAWLAAWREADRETGRRLDVLLADQPTLTAYDVAAAVFRALPAGGLLMVGASSPIRDLDVMARPAPVGERRKVIANRGLAGIDGTVSTAVGAALGRPHSTRNLALMGDLTFLHDQNGLVLGPHEPRPDLTIVVANDDGGAIFSMLEQGAPEHGTAFERLFGTPTGADLASACATTRTPHLRVTSRPELEQALASPNGGIEVVEATIGRADRRELDAAIRSLADPAVS